ncbi:MAG TPA: hypothetical protein VGJ60_07795 [Chloroflexota bacterium]|jgi:hypothetical protein
MATQPHTHYVWASPARWGLLILAVLTLLLAAFHANPFAPTVDLTDLGLALGFGAFLVPGP